MAMSFFHYGHAFCPLLSLQVRSQLYGLGVRRGRGRARLLGAAALVILLAGMAVTYMWLLGSSMVAVGADGAIPALAALAGSLAAVALVFAKAPGTVFGCRDYDLVAALPVGVVMVVVSVLGYLRSFTSSFLPSSSFVFVTVPASPFS